MARIYFDPSLTERAKQRLPENAIEGLPVALVRSRLDDVQRQRLIPFLGAGASQPTRRTPGPAPEVLRPKRADLLEKLREYNINQPIQLAFLDAAIQIAQSMGREPEEAVNMAEAPSSWELASILARSLGIQPFEPYGEALMNYLETAEALDADENLRICSEVVHEVAKQMDLHRSVPQLLTVASYFNARDRMIGLLHHRFRSVNVSNLIHKVVAESAHRFVDARNGDGGRPDKRDFVIITTNYDSLIDLELQRAGVPTCVVTVDPSCQVVIDFTPNSQECLKLGNEDFAQLKRRYTEDERRVLQKLDNPTTLGNSGPEAVANSESEVVEPPIYTPKKFTLANKTHSLAMVYKIHGSLEQRALTERDTDALVISDHDYVEFIQNNGASNDLIPAYINSRLMESRLLFLGYSFSDWNVRGLYRHFLKSRRIKTGVRVPEAQERDFIVMKSFRRTDDLFFESWDVSVMVVDLDTFARDIRAI